MNSFYSEEELKTIGFKHLGKNVLISRKTSIYGANKISIGNNVRIDDFSIISRNVTLGNYIHIATYCALYGGDAGIEMKDFTGLSSRGVIYAETDDYGGDYITNPTVDEEYRHIIPGKVTLEKHVIVGTGCSILPGVTLGEGAAVGSMSLVNKSLAPWGIYVGIPCKRIGDRKRGLLAKEEMISKKSI